MKNSMMKSFRYEIVIYSLLSFFYTFLTEAIFCLLVYIFTSVFGFYQKQNVMNNNNLDSNLNNGMLNNNYINGETINNQMNKSVDDIGGNSLFTNHLLPVFIGIAIIAGIGLFVIYFLLLTKKFSSYLLEISMGINEISAGNFNSRIEIKNEDEFTLIASRLNKMANDIQRIMENERKSENTKNELITSVAHDLRTPLTSIIGYLDLVSNDTTLSDKVKQDYIEIAYSKSKRLQKLIEDLFTYTQFSFGEVTLHKTRIDMVKFIDQLVDEFYPSFQEYDLDYDFTTNTNQAFVSVDGDLLARAFANLIENAVKYGRDGKKVRLRLIKNEDTVAISIVNYGELIPEADLDNIFDRFFRVESSRSRDTGGTGLGLAIAKNIIIMHEGTITAKSDFDGTVFEVTLKLESGT